jgi:hypothetical protein
MFKSSGDVTKTGSSSAIKIRTTPIDGYGARVVIPTTPDPATTILVRVLGSDDGSVYKEIARDPAGAVTRTTGTFREIVINFSAKVHYAIVDWTISATGSANYGAVQAGLVPATRVFDRTVRWD